MNRRHSWIFLAVLWLALTAAPGHAAVCDVDYDGDVDRRDITSILYSRNKPTSGPGDPMDEDGDGIITVLDGRRCVRRCTYPDCITNTRPEADISGPREPVCYGTTVTLDGSGSRDKEDDPLSFKWTLTKPDDSAAELSDATAKTPTFVADVKGRYEAKLVVSDRTSDSTPANLTITAPGPKADAGQDQRNVKSGETVKLSGANSAACSNNALTYSWKLKKSDGSTAELSDPTAVAPTFIADIACQYEAELTVNDGIESEPDTATIRTDSDDCSLKCGDLVETAVDESGKIDLFTFTGQKDNIVNLSLADIIWRDTSATVYTPSGMQLTKFHFTYEDVTLPEDGNYVIRVTTPGAYKLGLECILPTGPTEAILKYGNLYKGALESIGEAHLFTFTGQKDDAVVITIVETSNWGGVRVDYGARATVYTPRGQWLKTFQYVRWQRDRPDFMGSIILPESGNYIIKVHASYAASLGGFGSYNLELERILPPGPTATILKCGDLYKGELGGITDLFTFTGEKGDIVSLTLISTEHDDVFPEVAIVYPPSGTHSTGFYAGRQKIITLPEDGSYIIRIGSLNSFSSDAYTLGMQCLQSYPDSIANTPPKAEISAPEAPCYGSTVTLDGGSSRDKEHDMLSFQWTLTKPGGSTAELSDATAIYPTFAADVIGRYEAKLVVSDGRSDSTPASKTIKTRGPKADVGQDQLNVKIGETVKLSGGDSAACSDNALTYSWKLKKPDGSTAELSDPTAVAQTFIVDIDGHYEAELTVNDGFEGEPETVIIQTVGYGSLKCGNLVEGTIEDRDQIDPITFIGLEGDLVEMTLVQQTSDQRRKYNLVGSYAVVYSPNGKVLKRLYGHNDEDGIMRLSDSGKYVIHVKSLDLEPGMISSYNLGLECR